MVAQKISQKVAISVQFDMVTIELICGDAYAAQVLYDDLIDRLRCGEGITLSMDQDRLRQ
jgi:hypothetical protein